MQREIAALLRAYQVDRAKEDRAIGDILAAITEFASSREKFLSDLQDAAMAMTGSSRHTGSPPPLPESISEAIARAKQDMTGRYNN